jgi:hypothetical protein
MLTIGVWTLAFFVGGSGAEVRGIVRDAQTGEALSRVIVQVVETPRQTLTQSDGKFSLRELAAGAYTLKVVTVGYRMVERKFDLEEGETKQFEIALSPDVFRRSDSVMVRADPFEPAPQDGPTTFSIEGNEIKNLGSVLADDPLRAVHSLPGVSSNDDFEGRFSVHGAPYERVGLYLDGILLHQPFHTVQGEGPSGSMAAFNGDLTNSLKLETEGYSARFGDRTAGALDVETREGSRTQTSVRATASAADAGLMAEGPLGGGHRGSWLASVRKSYLQYLVQRTSDQPTMAFGFLDSQVQLSYDLGRGQKATLGVVDGESDFDRSHWRDRLGVNSAMSARYHFTLANLGWQFAPSGSFVVNSHAAFMRERYDDTNRDGSGLGGGFYGEWVWNTSASWRWSSGATLEAGASVRRIRGSGYEDYYYDAARHVAVEGHRGVALVEGGYAQQSWTPWKRLTLSAGARWDRSDADGVAVVSPQASATFAPWGSGRLQLSWGQYAQFPDVQQSYSVYGNPGLLPERATHYSAAFEQRIGTLSRVRIQAYQRNDRDLLFRPLMEARLTPSGIRPDNFQAPIGNALRGYARGIDVFFQRRTANRLTGWVSYSLGYARVRDAANGLAFYADQDQRHTVNVYLKYRVRPSVNLSAKWSYGSGFPVPGFFEQRGGIYYLTAVRNQARLGQYSRTDLRINKQKVFDRWKMTIYGEVVNVFNRGNYRFDSYDGFNARTGQAYLSFAKMFPILPSAGLMVEF